MDEPILVVISLTMFVGSYLAGCIPLFFTLNERRIRVASIFGAGLLVGTALCVIIPEGISALMESSRAASHQHGFPNTPERLPAFSPPIIDGSAEKKQPLKVKKEIFLDDYKRAGGTSFEPKEVPSMERSENRQHQVVRRSVGTLTKREVASAVQENAPTSAEHGHDGDKKRTDNEMNLDKPIGVSLLIGFLFMFVVDQLAKMTHGRNKSLSTLGLVIHAFADGIAMGSASSAGNQMEMQILVFVAIMLHKAPAAFALVSILLVQGLEKVRIRRHLLAFSLAAPIGTLLTYALLHTQSQIASVPSGGAAEEESPSRITGLILLFSAGTFLYIATVHVLPELIESKCNNSSSTHGGMSGSRELLLGGGHSSGSLVGPISRLSLFEICLFCVSALIPAFISSASHGHGH